MTNTLLLFCVSTVMKKTDIDSLRGTNACQNLIYRNHLIVVKYHSMQARVLRITTGHHLVQVYELCQL